jgi:hypothetical protein
MEGTADGTSEDRGRADTESRGVEGLALNREILRFAQNDRSVKPMRRGSASP